MKEACILEDTSFFDANVWN